MAHETIDFRDRITTNPRVMVGKPVVKGTRIPVERVILHLATTLDTEDVFSTFPELSREDVQAVLAYAYEQVVAATPAFQTPQDFYKEAIQREDIRRILTELAK